MGFGKRIDGPGYMDQRQIECCARHQLEGGQLIGGRGARMSEERHDILDPGEPEKKRSRLPAALERASGSPR
jgi:hypothetical protein